MIQIELILKNSNRYILTRNDLFKIFPYNKFEKGKSVITNHKSKISELEKIALNKNAEEILMSNLKSGHFRLLNITHKDYSLDDLIDSVNYCFKA